MIKNFEEMEEAARAGMSKRLVLAMSQEADALRAVLNAAGKQIVTPILVGDLQEIRKTAEKAELEIDAFKIVSAEDEKEAAAKAVQLVRAGEADLLMKGKVPTATLMRAVLDRKTGLRGAGVLSQVTIIEAETYPKFLIMTDTGLNIAPDLKTKVALINNAVKAAQKLGVELPKVAVIAAVEKVNPGAMPVTVEAALLSKMAERGQIRGCLVDGPLALDNAVSAKSCRIKGIESKVGGDADILLMPDIEAANVFYKALAYLANFKLAGIIMGANAPVIMSSRADSDTIKFYSILAGVFMA